jgi:hypothetical protein
MNIMNNITHFFSRSHAQRQKDRLQMAAMKHLEDGITTYHSSWMTSDFGCSDFRKVLEHQKQLHASFEEHPSMAMTHLWIGRSLQKQSNHEETQACFEDPAATWYMVQTHHRHDPGLHG